MIEASHKSIIRFMRLLPEKVNLEQALVTALWVDRTTVRKRTGFTPQYLVYGFEGHSPLANLIRHNPDIRTYSEDELFLFRFQQLYHRQHEITSALDTQRRTREHHKEVFDNRYDTLTKLQSGDLVLVTDGDFTHPNKLGQRWAGPYKIRKILSRTYYLQSLSGIRILRRYTREMIKPFHLRKRNV
ncbi:hypothetical protein LELG_04921 [Lodderomyces elongisporus NRRL YB-4239]|uniref:Uncharacterized protein n=1 Tax=Lodderomyces elongisporus (strain ATCC 11503 / CBS 2605 / JCM 1781 / NBRC 1676 / NRRL YB-4239) TaxID=379508 RepID=A5E5N2_LODEL|nr:hypothetical protein LELG_04921 [Lodderomyces elongisporus NRRL YB-4239]